MSISNRRSPVASAKGDRIPGPRSQQLARRLARVESRNITYASPEFPVFWESARGAYVRDVDGNRFLDLTSAFAVSSLGHNAPAVLAALQKQSKKMWHGMGDVHPNAVKVELLELLAKLAPGNLSVSILSSTGAEAVESALKTARLYTGRSGVLAFEGGYHGLTYGALPTTSRRDFRDPFAGQWHDFATHVRYPDPLHGWSDDQALSVVDRALREGTPAGEIGAILVEPIQGRGGIRVGSREFLRGLRKLAYEHKVLLIVDEVFTGFARTGNRFAIQDSGVVPDLLCLGKAMANGFPISVCMGSRELMRAWSPSDGEAVHTSTFLGNPLGCAMAIASIRSIESQKLAQRAKTLGHWWLKELRSTLGSLPQVAEVRGRGLMIGIELMNATLAAHVVTEGLKEGLILLSGGNARNVISLTPPLIVSKSDLSRATKILERIIHGTT